MEIMVVVAILGLLVSMAVPVYRMVNRKSKLSAAENLLRQYAAAASQYYLENGVTTVNVSELVGSDAYVVVPPHQAFSNAELTNGGQITAGVPMVLTGLDIGDVTRGF